MQEYPPAIPSPESGPKPVAKPRPKKAARTFWLKQLHTWHWMSSAICLIGLLLFTITGITLNHAAEIEAEPVTAERTAQLPAALLPTVAPDDGDDVKKPLPAPVAAWIGQTLNVPTSGIAEWSVDSVYLPLPRPGGDGWVSIDRATGAITSEETSRGAIAWLNDLHKGRNSGTAWKWFIDIFAVACLIFSLSGLFLLQLHASKRRSTWPIVGAGLVIPAILAVYFIH